MAQTFAREYGGSREAVQHHYDAGQAFYECWLDARMIYSCALWRRDRPDDTLEQAQLEKLHFHCDAVGAGSGGRYLDIGCGWGALLDYLRVECGADHVTGLTLSRHQFDHISGKGQAGVDVRLENWAEHRPKAPLDGIVSIGAFEHFAEPSQSRSERIALYRDFFSRCASWLDVGGRLSLQTIAYGDMRPEEANSFIANEIFPNAELPYLSDIVQAAEGQLEVVKMRNDALDYARTCAEWARRLRRNTDGPLSKRYYRYLRLSETGFRMGKLQLLRIAFRKPGWQSA